MYSDKFTLAALSLILAAALWALVFYFRPFNFWIMMSSSTILLLLLSMFINREKISVNVSKKMVAIGVLSAVLLYGLFYSGFQMTKANPIFSEGVSRVYDFRASAPALAIGFILIFPIAPGEEVYWRGLIQRRFAERIGSSGGFVLATVAYALVHLPTLNPPLILTAFIGGLVWGYVYRLTASLVPGIISHIIFDLLIFVVAPLS